MKALIDTNVLLDVLQHREPHYAHSARVWTLADLKAFDAYVSAVSMNNSFYVLRKLIGASGALDCVRLIRRSFNIVPLDVAVVDQALGSAGNDLEDAIQAASAKIISADCVVTRDPSGFKNFQIRTFRPEELISAIGP
jgi:predicted nucleic acid-binding protein